MIRSKLLIFICLFGYVFKQQAQNKILVDVSQDYVTSYVKVKNAKARFRPDKSIVIDMEKSKPLVELYAPETHWDLHNNTSVAFEVENLGETSIMLNCHIDNHKWSEGLLILNPGENGVMRVLIKGNKLAEQHPLKRSYLKMNGLPGGYLDHWDPLDAAHVKKISLSLINPKTGAKLSIRKLIAEGDLLAKSYNEIQKTGFPFIDIYGQFTKKEWQGKIHIDLDFKIAKEKELKDLNASPSPKNRSKYGGWTSGPKLKATGHFRVEKVKGKWWFVDPDGYLFWSHGITGVANDGAVTQVAGRKHYFSKLPKKGTASYAFAKEKKGKVVSYNFTASNLLRKYGKDWSAIKSELAHKRLRSWGMNTIGNWSDTDTYMQRKTPYTVNVAYTKRKIGGILKFPDVFDANFKTNLQKGFLKQSKTWNDDYCIGYFVDNELHDWGKIGKLVLTFPANANAKIELINFLRNKYSEITSLNSAWKTGYKSWNELLNSKQKAKGKVAFSDLLDFEKIVVDLYYKTCKEVIEEKAPNKLYLGSRLHNHYYPNNLSHQKWIVPIAAKYCDVISFNRYRFVPNDLKPHDITIDKPIIIGEFHFGALDRGMLHTGLRSVQNQEQRGKAYVAYLKGALENPYLVGAHWFQYSEQAVTGRGDGENYQIGFLDVCDTPYQETIDASREIGCKMYRVREQAKQNIK
ncbi:hypothetical protein [Algibacter mikhailovii]|uniref:Beta-agarase n=1 Tax=Algibacter mikhailovii TaxID=425498 RepID=A0A918VC52_9FLAO|nr:hypothetical protein [Algibacter mikhailovii]GGZ87476.1 hypothetical protein GCM10007028_27080 [Algibacter mikhailovii]